jgi:hypothetical protein
MVFDAQFYRTALAEYVTQQQCRIPSGHVPVLQLSLADGGTLDICHIIALADTWLSVAYFRDPFQDDETDTAFLPYGLVQRILLSAHSPSVRRIGFDITRSAKALAPPPASALPASALPASA